MVMTKMNRNCPLQCRQAIVQACEETVTSCSFLHTVGLGEPRVMHLPCVHHHCGSREGHRAHWQADRGPWDLGVRGGALGKTMGSHPRRSRRKRNSESKNAFWLLLIFAGQRDHPRHQTAGPRQASPHHLHHHAQSSAHAGRRGGLT